MLLKFRLKYLLCNDYLISHLLHLWINYKVVICFSKRLRQKKNSTQVFGIILKSNLKKFIYSKVEHIKPQSILNQASFHFLSVDCKNLILMFRSC